jgi:DNA-binding LacI/PurR family transcriptional regulator/DNA-binding CsgD family transcriptional regulator
MHLAVFVGRSLSSPYADEDQHNRIYSLARSRKLAGLVVTAGSIGTYRTDEELKNFLDSYTPVPVVTIGRAVSGIPAIITDNRNGITSVVRHLVTAHQANRIAFLGGTITSPDANERLESFRDAIRESALELREELIYPCDFSFRKSRELASTIPIDMGLPFDAVVSSNDEMAFGFMAGLKERGFRAPTDYLITGFDNVPEEEHLSPALTTVYQPLYEEGVLAGETMLALIAGNTVPERTVMPASPVIRESCGCFETTPIRSRYSANPSGNELRSEDREIRREEIVNAVRPAITLSAAEKQKAGEATGALFDTLALDLRTLRDRPLFLPTFGDWLDISCEWENSSTVWQTILSKLQDEALARTTDMRQRLYLEDIFRNAYAILARFMGREAGHEVGAARRYIENFRNLSRRLEECETLEALLDAIAENARNFPFAGITVCLHDADQGQTGASARKPEYDRMKYRTRDGKTETFNADEIVPATENADERELTIMPLQGRDTSFGYIAFAGERTDPGLFDTFRDYVSRALDSLDRLERSRNSGKDIDLAMRKLKEDAARFREMAEDLPVLAIETGTSLAVRYANGAARRCLRLDTELATLAPYIHRDDHSRLTAIVAKLEAERHIAFPGIRIIAPGGTRLIPVLGISSVYGNDGGSVTGIRWYILDPEPIIPGLILPDSSFFESRHLSARETEIAELALQGIRIRDIAERLFIAESTVKGHLAHVYDKFGISGRADLMKIAEAEQATRYGANAYLFSVLGGMLTRDMPDDD